MAWIYLAESEALPAPLIHGCAPSPIVKMTDTLRPCFCPECSDVSFVELRYGLTCERCNSEEWISPFPWTSSQEDSPARTLALQEMERVWAEADRGYFSKSFASFANFDPDSFSWKTSQQSLFGGLTEFSWSSLRWGTIVDGRLYQPQRWEPRTSESAGSYLPTPLAQDCGTQNNRKGGVSKPSLPQMAREGRWPTPRAHETGNYQRDRGVKGKERPTLTGAVKKWPTPRASEAERGHGGARNREEHQKTLSQTIGGQLNPTWVEWLMGYPSEWTVLEGWAMQWFRSKRASRFKGLSELKEATDG